MALSGIALVIFDSRIIHRWLRKLKIQFRRSQREQNVEIGENTNPPEVNPQPRETQSEPNPIQVDSNNEPSTSLRNRQQSQQDNTPETSGPRVSAENVKIPYSILTGLIIFTFFIISFVTIMVIRGVVHNAPVLFEFFANMYLAGTSFSSFNSADFY